MQALLEKLICNFVGSTLVFTVVNIIFLVLYKVFIFVLKKSQPTTIKTLIIFQTFIFFYAFRVNSSLIFRTFLKKRTCSTFLKKGCNWQFLKKHSRLLQQHREQAINNQNHSCKCIPRVTKSCVYIMGP